MLRPPHTSYRRLFSGMEAELLAALPAGLQLLSRDGRRLWLLRNPAGGV